MKNKTSIWVLVALVAIAAIAFITLNNKTEKTELVPKTETKSVKNATYTIEGKPVTLVNGTASVEAAPGSASKITTQYFGNEVTHDLNGDGRLDTAFILTQNTGGSGTFYYVVAALNTENGYVGSHGLLLGDRIAPQTTEISHDPSAPHVVVVNYADRKPGESFAVQPSVGKSIWLMLDPITMQFGEVAQNFEGEADPAKMTLSMKKWIWVRTTNGNSTVTPRDENKFTLTFTQPNRFSAITDCNGVGGEYTQVGSKIAFEKMMSTLMFCENSQEGEFSKALSDIKAYHFTGKGELVFDLKSNNGTMTFK